MRTIVIGIIILITLLIISFILKVDTPVVVNVGGQDGLPLNNKSYTFNIYSPTKFNALSVRFLTSNFPVSNKIEFVINKNGRKLIEHAFDKGGLAHGEFYKFNFKALQAGKYELLIRGHKGTPYKLMYDKKKQELSSLGNTAPASFSYKLFTEKSVAYVISTAAKRAAQYWFRLGYLYQLSILLYLVLIASIFAILITDKAYAKTKL